MVTRYGRIRSTVSKSVRSKASKKAWQTRRKEKLPICPFCHKKVFVGGTKFRNRIYHVNCAERVQFIEARKKTKRTR